MSHPHFVSLIYKGLGTLKFFSIVSLLEMTAE